MTNRGLFACIALTAAALLTTSLWIVRTESAPAALAGEDRLFRAERDAHAEPTSREPQLLAAKETAVEQPDEKDVANTASTIAAKSGVESVNGFTIRGRVRCQAGRLDPREVGTFDVYLWKWVRGARDRSQTVVQWEDVGFGRIEGTFVFDDLSPGPWRLDPSCPGFFLVEPPVVIVEAPAQIEFVIRDAAGWSDLSLEAFDDETGAAIEHYRVEARGGLKLAGNEFAPFLPTRDRVFAHWWANDLPGTWRVTADGYLSVDGHVADLLPVRAGERPRRSGRVYLKRGTEITFECRHADENGTMLPLSGVEVFLDDVRMGESSDDGQVLAKFPGVPRTVRFLKLGWRLFSAPFDVATGELDDPREAVYYVVFEPSP